MHATQPPSTSLTILFSMLPPFFFWVFFCHERGDSVGSFCAARAIAGCSGAAHGPDERIWIVLNAHQLTPAAVAAPAPHSIQHHTPAVSSDWQ
mmetsp:Transcript_12557/g.21703  ORF Transcript_12557/g.21703 Transcript_12557/m.21703 type:complete len:93 (-) Transcript_12557:192-470(-)